MTKAIFNSPSIEHRFEEEDFFYNENLLEPLCGPIMFVCVQLLWNCGTYCIWDPLFSTDVWNMVADVRSNLFPQDYHLLDGCATNARKEI